MSKKDFKQIEWRIFAGYCKYVNHGRCSFNGYEKQPPCVKANCPAWFPKLCKQNNES